ncbi:MAG: hypothetical protein MIL41_16855 [Hyphomicrobiales bacterium]
MLARPALSTPPASPPPADVVYDHSGGHRARVTRHAIRRYCERAIGVDPEICEGMPDRDAVAVYRTMGMPIGRIVDWLAFYGGVAARHGASGVRRDGVDLRLAGDVVVTIVSKRGDRRS